MVNENAEEYIQRMSKDKEWAGEHELAALASALEVNIKVVTPTEDADEAIRSYGNFEGPTILLGLYNCHYCSLRPISPDEKGKLLIGSNTVMYSCERDLPIRDRNPLEIIICCFLVI